MDSADATVLLPRELVNLHHIAGWQDSWRYKLQYILTEFGPERAVTVATDSRVMVVIEWVRPGTSGYAAFFEGKKFYIHGSSLRVANYMQSTLKDNYGSREVYLNGNGKLVVCGHIIETPHYPKTPPGDDEWLDWRGAIMNAVKGVEDTCDPSQHGHLSEVQMDLDLLEKIRKYVRSCGSQPAMHFKFTDPTEVIQARIGTVTHLLRRGVRMDFFLMPMRFDAGKWEAHDFLREES